MDKNAPIGIFDSGIGGLTVARAVNQILPHERLIYFGDTAHLPYGEKSSAAIQAYSVKIADVLISEGCKAIVIACNSASAVAFDLVKEYAASKSKVINVIDPMVDHVIANFQGKHVGLIGTRRTVQSNTYVEKIHAKDPQFKLSSLTTALLVPMIEEGFIKNQISHDIISNYLDDDSIRGINALILGCTHYPLIKNEIELHFKNKVKALDSSEIVARNLQQYLIVNDLLAEKRAGAGLNKFFVSDYTDSFELLTKRFFGEQIHLVKYRLWE